MLTYHMCYATLLPYSNYFNLFLQYTQSKLWILLPVHNRTFPVFLTYKIMLSSGPKTWLIINIVHGFKIMINWQIVKNEMSTSNCYFRAI